MALDLERAAKLGYDIKKLESRKKQLETDIERAERDLKAKLSAADKDIAQRGERAIQESRRLILQAQQKEEQASKILKTAETRDKESLAIEAQLIQLKKERAALETEKASTQKAKESFLERERLAQLKEEQFNYRLSELNKLSPSPPAKGLTTKRSNRKK